VVTCFVVPTGEVWIVRDIDAYNNSGSSAADCYFVDAISNGTFYYAKNAAVSKDSVQWRGRQVFGAGGSVYVNPNGNTWDIRISGYKLLA
jgi:hypothetical protein